MMSDPQREDASSKPLSRRARRELRGDTGLRLNAVPFILAAIIVVIVTVGLLWWFLLRTPPAEETAWEWVDEPGLDGIHARGVPAVDWEAGWCLTGYVDEDAPADVVDCEQSYDAQVLLRENIGDGAYPGDQVVIDTSHQWCHDELPLDPESVDRVDYELQIELWHPTESTWSNDYDRMVSCFLTRADGGQLSGDFLTDSTTESEDDASEAVEDADIDIVEEPREEEDPTEEPDDDADEEDSD